MHSAADQDALGVHAAEDVAEALAFLADQVLGRHAQVVEEHLGGRVVHHGADRIDLQRVAGRMHVDEEYGEAVSALLHLLARRSAGEQQHQVGMLGTRGPDLLPVDHVAVVAVAHRGGAQRERVGARGRLGHAERLQPQLAGCDLRQIALLLVGIAVPQHRAHGVHLRVAGRAVAARGVDLLHDGDGGRHREPAAAVFLGDQRGEEAGLRQRIDEVDRIGALAIEVAPVLAGEAGAQRPHRGADAGDLFGFARSGHQLAISARPLLSATTSRSTTRARKLTTAPSRHISVRIVSPG